LVAASSRVVLLSVRIVSRRDDFDRFSSEKAGADYSASCAPLVAAAAVCYYLFKSSHAATILIDSPLKRRVQIIQLHVLLWLRPRAAL
jgi:hypothetical protein